MIRHLCVAALLLSNFLLGCSPADWHTAKTISVTMACTIAAANNTPCSPAESLEYLSDLQRREAEAIASRASVVDPKLVALILELLAANNASNRELVDRLLKLSSSAPQSTGVSP